MQSPLKRCVSILKKKKNSLAPVVVDEIDGCVLSTFFNCGGEIFHRPFLSCVPFVCSFLIHFIFRSIWRQKLTTKSMIYLNSLYMLRKVEYFISMCVDKISTLTFSRKNRSTIYINASCHTHAAARLYYIPTNPTYLSISSFPSSLFGTDRKIWKKLGQILKNTEICKKKMIKKQKRWKLCVALYLEFVCCWPTIYIPSITIFLSLD